MSHLTVSPAYGRDYKSGKAARADWDANKDFVIQSMSFRGSYVNKGQSQELLDAGISEVMIRYKRMENFVLVKLSVPATPKKPRQPYTRPHDHESQPYTPGEPGSPCCVCGRTH